MQTINLLYARPNIGLQVFSLLPAASALIFHGLDSAIAELIPTKSMHIGPTIKMSPYDPDYKTRFSTKSVALNLRSTGGRNIAFSVQK